MISMSHAKFQLGTPSFLQCSKWERSPVLFLLFPLYVERSLSSCTARACPSLHGIISLFAGYLEDMVYTAHQNCTVCNRHRYDRSVELCRWWREKQECEQEPPKWARVGLPWLRCCPAEPLYSTDRMLTKTVNLMWHFPWYRGSRIKNAIPRNDKSLLKFGLRHIPAIWTQKQWWGRDVLRAQFDSGTPQ